MKRYSFLFTWTLAAFVGAGACAYSAPIGQLLDVQGRVQIRRGRQPARAAGLLAELQPGDTLSVQRGLAEVVLFQKGARFSLATGAAVRVGATGLQRLSGPPPQPLPGLPQPFAQALSVPRRPVPSKLLGVLVRSGEDDTVGPRRLSPDGTVRQLPVTLRWEGPIEGDRQVLQVSDGERIVHRASLGVQARSYELPAGKLRPGPWYVWFVTATGEAEGPHKGYARLRLLTPQERAALEREERQAAAAQATMPHHPAATMRLARLYELLGMFEQARTSYQTVQRLRPEDLTVRAALTRLDGAASP